MDETRFHQLTDPLLELLSDRIEAGDAKGDLEVDLAHGALNIQADGGQTLLLSKHAPTRQLWLSTPALGGLHFRHDPENDGWYLPDGSELKRVLMEEIRRVSGLDILL